MIVGAIFFMVVAVLPYILKQNELNKGLTAARDGAVYGASLEAMKRGGIIKIGKLDLQKEGCDEELTGYNINIEIRSVHDFPDKTEIQKEIENAALNFTYYAFNGEWPNASISQVNARYHCFTFNSTWK
jgi:hypothetical protein